MLTIRRGSRTTPRRSPGSTWRLAGGLRRASAGRARPARTSAGLGARRRDIATADPEHPHHARRGRTGRSSGSSPSGRTAATRTPTTSDRAAARCVAIYVRAGARSDGRRPALLDAARGRCAGRGWRRSGCGCWRTTPRARAFYDRYGFVAGRWARHLPSRWPRRTRRSSCASCGYAGRLAAEPGSATGGSAGRPAARC